MRRKWKLRILTPYIIMLAIYLFHPLRFGAAGVHHPLFFPTFFRILQLVIVTQTITIEIPLILLYTIALVVAVVIRAILRRRRNKEERS